MAPDRLALALTRLHGAIVDSQAAAVLEPLRPSASRPRPELQALLQVFADLATGRAEFGEPERSLLAAFGLDALMDTAWWAALITACNRATMTEEAAAMIEAVQVRLQVATDTFPALARLLDARAAPQRNESGGVVLLVPGVDGAPPALPRLAAAMEGLSQLWTVAEDLTGQRGALRLTGVEAGAAVTLHVDGLAEPLAELRALLASIPDQLDRLVQVPAEQHPVLLPEMLPVMQRIGQGGRSDAMRVRTAVEGGVRRLLEAGCAFRATYRGDGSGDAAGGPPQSAGRAKAPPAQAASEDDLNHLAAVIAQERSQLKQPEPGRRLWQGNTTAQSV